MADPTSTRSRRLAWLRYPVLGSLLKSRRASVVISIVLGLQLLAAVFGVSVYRCPILSLTGVPCPGCGLSRGAVATLLLDPAGVLWWNAFGPAALAVVLLVLVSGALPARPRARLLAALIKLEQKTGVTNIAFCLLWVYWVYRLIVLGGDLGVRLSAHS